MEFLQYLQQMFDQAAACVGQPSSCVTMVQFWVALGTGSALVIGFARWAAMKLQKKTIEDRLERIEGRIDASSPRKGKGGDCELVRAHRTLFTRPAFTRSCIQELSIPLLAEVMDETLAALGTGTHYDAKGQVRAEFGDLHAYRRKNNRKSVAGIYECLQRLQWQLREFDQFLRQCPAAHYPAREFISAGLSQRTDPSTWKGVLGRCDRIDEERNKVIALFNGMLARCGELPLPLIHLSSTWQR